MNQKSKLLEVLDESLIEDNQTDFSLVTYRTSQKIGTMIEIMGIVLQKPVSNLFTTLISERLVDDLLSDASNMNILMDFFESEQKPSGFLRLLEERKVIEPSFDFDIEFDI